MDVGSPTHLPTPTQLALSHFVDRYVAEYPRLTAPYDAGWRSTCELGEPFLEDDRRLIAWRPLERPAHNDFTGLEHALEFAVHPDIKAYYGSFWSGNLEAECAEGHVSLLLLWNSSDVDRLIENLIGHALNKRRRREPMTVFFACTEPDSELVLCVDNTSGEVVLEQSDGKAVRRVAPSLAEFLGTLAPAPPVVV